MSNILTAIKARWAANTDLTDICPAEQFTKGLRLDNKDHLPLATITRESERKTWSNSTPVIVTTSRLTLWVKRNVDGESLKALIETQFDNTDWESGSLKVIYSRIENAFDFQDPDDETIWQFAFDIETHHWKA